MSDTTHPLEMPTQAIHPVLLEHLALLGHRKAVVEQEQGALVLVAEACGAQRQMVLGALLVVAVQSGVENIHLPGVPPAVGELFGAVRKEAATAQHPAGEPSGAQRLPALNVRHPVAELFGVQASPLEAAESVHPVVSFATSSAQ